MGFDKARGSRLKFKLRDRLSIRRRNRTGEPVATSMSDEPDKSKQPRQESKGPDIQLDAGKKKSDR